MGVGETLSKNLWGGSMVILCRGFEETLYGDSKGKISKETVTGSWESLLRESVESLLRESVGRDSELTVL